jgi:SAM-dependent methyltransferase
MTLRQTLFYFLDRRLMPWALRIYGRLKSALPEDIQLLPSQVDGRQELKIIDNLADLDAALLEVDKAREISDDEARRRMAQIHYVLNGNYPADPYSPEYAAAQMDTYRALSGRTTYQAAVNERSVLNLEWEKRWYYPYGTRSPATVGEQLIAQGFIIRVLNLPAGASVIEFGPGSGNLTMHLAQMGYAVTAVEVDPNWAELIRYRAQTLGVEVVVVEQDMLALAPSRQYDAAVFFESFHHCVDHLRLLRSLYTLIAPHGLVAFAAEPIFDAPYPWGFIRPDGQTLWSIRKFGWFELGFDTSYFLRTLLLFGWLPRRYRSDVAHLADVIVAHKSQGLYHPSELTLPPDEAATWSAPEPEHRFTTSKSVMSCSRAGPVQAVEFCLTNSAPFPLDITLTAGTASRSVRLPAQSEKTVVSVEAQDWQGQVTIASKTWRPALVYKSADARTLGVAVHWVRLQED